MAMGRSPSFVASNIQIMKTRSFVTFMHFSPLTWTVAQKSLMNSVLCRAGPDSEVAHGEQGTGAVTSDSVLAHQKSSELQGNTSESPMGLRGPCEQDPSSHYEYIHTDSHSHQEPGI